MQCVKKDFCDLFIKEACIKNETNGLIPVHASLTCNLSK